MTDHRLTALAALILALAVVTGAFGAHGLKALVTPEQLAVWHTAVLYQVIHGLGLLAIAALTPRFGGRLLRAAAGFLLFGIVVFSGSLYVLILANTPWLGAITPIGGTGFIIGWILLALAALRAPA